MGHQDEDRVGVVGRLEEEAGKLDYSWKPGLCLLNGSRVQVYLTCGIYIV